MVPDVVLPEGQVCLTPKEISLLRIKIGKSHRTPKDWDYIKTLLSGKAMFTACPMVEEFEKNCSVEGILKDDGYLIVFTSMEACLNYLNNRGTEDFGHDLSIGTIPFDTLQLIASDYKMRCLIDPNDSQGSNILTLDGAHKTINISRLEKIR